MTAVLLLKEKKSFSIKYESYNILSAHEVCRQPSMSWTKSDMVMDSMSCSKSSSTFSDANMLISVWIIFYLIKFVLFPLSFEESFTEKILPII